MIKYSRATDIEERVTFILKKLSMDHIDPSRVKCIRSFGSKSKRTLARCYALPKIMQKALDQPAYYVIEVISERFDKLSKEEKTKTLIHEILHIPKSFGGGFRHHRPYVNKKTVEEFYKKFID